MGMANNELRDRVAAARSSLEALRESSREMPTPAMGYPEMSQEWQDYLVDLTSRLADLRLLIQDLTIEAVEDMCRRKQVHIASQSAITRSLQQGNSIAAGRVIFKHRAQFAVGRATRIVKDLQELEKDADVSFRALRLSCEMGDGSLPVGKLALIDGGEA